ncbi:MAG: hypothetical protein ACO1SV_07815 [Fimbriimonas sp.]
MGNSSKGKTSCTRRKAQAVQWIAYLLVGIALGACWLPVANLISSTEGIREWIWVLGTGFLFSLLFRAVTQWQGEEPSGWFAFAFPVAAAIGRLSANAATGVKGEFGASGIEDFMTIWLYGSTCFGLLVIPLAFAHLSLMRCAHRWLADWGNRATWRQANHGAYAVAGLLLILATDGRSFLAARPRKGFVRAETSHLSVYGLDFPAGCVAVDPYNTMGTASDAFWVRCSEPLPIPGSLESRPVTEPEKASVIVQRAMVFADPTIYAKAAKVTQRKWSHYGEDIRANIVRVGKVEYVELINASPPLRAGDDPSE